MLQGQAVRWNIRCFVGVFDGMSDGMLNRMFGGMFDVLSQEPSVLNVVVGVNEHKLEDCHVICTAVCKACRA